MSMNGETVTCRSCGAEIDAGALLCPKCGQPNVSTAFATPGYFAPSEPLPPKQEPARPVEGAHAETAAIEPEHPADQAVEMRAQPVLPTTPAPREARTVTFPRPAPRQAPTLESEYHCPECAAPVGPGAHLCENCGHPFDARGTVESTLGGIGALIGELLPWSLKYCPFYALLIFGVMGAVTLFVAAGIRRLGRHPLTTKRTRLTG